jgi:uncharacterized membrane protein
MGPIPGWNSLHPLVIHFPIALLFVAPFFVGMSIVFSSSRKCFAVSAFCLMFFGIMGAIVAVLTGEAAGELVERTGEISAVLERHQSLAELSRNLFVGLCLLFGVIAFVPEMVKKSLSSKAYFFACGGFVVLYLVALSVLILAAHQGGMLVHKFGVRSLM